MWNLRNLPISAVAMALVMNCGFTGWSQEKGISVSRELRSTDLPAARVMTPQENDHRIARWLIIDNRMIFDCAKLGKERAERADVRRFAEMLIADHQKRLDDLNALSGKKVAQEKAADGSTKKNPESQEKKIENRNNDAASGLGDNSPDRSRTAVLVHDYGTSRDSRMVFHPTDFLAIREDVFGHLNEIAKKEWEGLSGAEFDRLFLKHQILAHELLISTIQAIRPTASTELQSSLDRDLGKWKVHLQMARNLSDPTIKTTGVNLDRRAIKLPGSPQASSADKK